MSSKLMKRTAKTRRGRKALKERESKVVENPKTAMFIRGPTSDAIISAAMKELAMIKQPLCIKYSRKTQIRPFDDDTEILNYARKADASLFAHSSSSKKRPRNLTMGRLFNHELLDMFEFGILSFQSMTEFGGVSHALGSKPCFVLDGPEWRENDLFHTIGNFFVDFFHARVVNQINLAGLDHVIFLSIVDNVIHFRHYAIEMKRSGTKIPRVELKDIGPHMELVVRRHQMATADVRKAALRVPPEIRGLKRKNVTTNVFGDKIGRIHMPRQELSQLSLARPKALKRRKTSVGGAKEKNGEEKK